MNPSLLQLPIGRFRESTVTVNTLKKRVTQTMVRRSITALTALQIICCTVDTAAAFVVPRPSLLPVRSMASSTSLKVLRSPMQDNVVGSRTSSTGNIFDADDFSSENVEVVKEISDSSSFFIEALSEKIGRVTDDRIIFPEYDAGEVPRVFSSLKYHKSEETGQVFAQHATGSVFGAASLVAGTMVGAGVLALPSATAPVGFLPSTAAMGVGWFYMTISGLLIAELSINRLGQSGKPGKGMLDLFEDSLGPRWSKIGSLAYFGLHYCLLVAYIAQGGANLNALTGLENLGLPSGIPQASFAALCAVGLYSAKPSAVEKVNNLFVFTLATAFAAIIGLGARTADFSSLLDLSNQHPENVLDAFPIIFLSLVYQNIVPTIVNQLEGDRTKITKAIIGGTTIPTLMFLAWNAVVLGNVDPSAATSIDPVALLQASASTGSGNAVLGILVSTFSTLAIVTSLIGFVYGLLDAWTDVFRLPSDGPGFEKWKAPLYGLVFLPPLALSMTDPDVFFKALDIGGAFGVSTLFLVLPPIMVWKQRYGNEQQLLMTKPMGKYCYRY
jgi:tyrosine-specific transport protein